MTGLDPELDKIVEVAAIVTDWNFNEIGTFEAVVKVDPKLFADRIASAPDFWNTYPEVRDALLAQNNSDKATDVLAVEEGLLSFLEEHFDLDAPVLLAGNSIHQDRKFIDSEWKKVSARLHYRMLDVSAWKVVFDGKYNKRFAKPEVHRALDDIRGSIMELKYYLGKVRV